jgi:hypothetical protein
LIVRIVVASFVVVAGVLWHVPARAADVAGWSAAAVHAEPYVFYDFEPGIVVRAYWLEPWAGRHYFPSGGKLPVVGRREQLKPAMISEKNSFHREWSSFPVDTIEQPPLILNQPQYFPRASDAPPSPALSK